MIFHATRLLGVFEIDLQLHQDERGFFARSWCRNEFEQHGLNPSLVQCNVSFNRKRGTLRGLHLQAAPHAEAKLVRCTRGALFDVAVDLRPGSPTYLTWTGSTLTAENRRALYIPEGCAHGFLTLEDGTEIFYQMSGFYEPSASCGFRWNDPTFGIDWPGEVTVISERDASYPDFRSE
jgi:dTDP-4-dehydrorhamnose 3,5-epimerase